MRTNIAIDELGRQHVFYIKSFKSNGRFDIDNKNTILFDFTYRFVNSLKVQDYNLNKIRLIFLFRHPLRTTQFASIPGVFNRVHEDYSIHIYNTYGIYLKVADLYDYDYKNNIKFQYDMNHYNSGLSLEPPYSENCILIHPSFITTIIPYEIKEYFKSVEMYDVGLDLLKKRLCQEIMIDIDKIRKPLYSYDEF